MKNLLFCLLFLPFSLCAQELPFSDIQKTPENYTTGTVVARMVDGLGFRFHWASKGLLPNDLAFGPEGEGRNILQTMEHIYSLTQSTLIALDDDRSTPEPMPKEYQELRAATLLGLKKASDLLRQMKEEEISSVRFNGLPFWNIINGPVADAIYHTGQIVLLRRMSGNPIAKGVNVLMGSKN